ncbi:MAG: hypothetical protein HC854_11815 [Flavobacterium sp.]|nr:hypothetical protein [Flavobacterium sp.]
MSRLKENIPFTYERGKCKISGRTEDDRKALKIEIILYWTWRIILAIGILFGTVYKVIG